MLQDDFPALRIEVNGNRLAYLDNASTTQKPQIVIDALSEYYGTMNANIHRGVHYLSEQATIGYEAARESVRKFINAKELHECIFVRGTTEAINLVATSYGTNIKADDEIIVTTMEHHSNIVPWQLLSERTGAKLVVLPINKAGELEIDLLDSLISNNTRIIALSHISNSLGTINPIKDICHKARELGIITVIDGAQALAHVKVDVQDIGCDFYATSAHKAYGPLGIGILYGREDLLLAMPPYQGGGDMILQVSFDKVTYNSLPYKFEAGTPSIGDAYAFGKTLEYLSKLDRAAVDRHEQQLLKLAMSKLQTIPGIKFYGQAQQKIAIISFTIDGVHPHDIGSILNQYGVAVRTGHHCNMPLMEFYGIAGTVRASIALYNTEQDIEQLYQALLAACKLFKVG